MANLAPVIERVVDAIEPRSIVEVGVFRGDLSLYLLRVAARVGASLDLVDVSLPASVRDRILAARPPGVDVRFLEMRSQQALSELRSCDLVFLDGDHNHETVSAELAACFAGDRAPVVLLHDVGWPLGRWDMAYEPATLADPNAFGPGLLTPFSGSTQERFGLAFPPVRATSGGPRNGVLTAVEDFLAASPGQYEYFQINLFFGLGVLWRKSRLAPDSADGLRKVRDDFEPAAALFAACELNRLMLLIRLNESGRVWKLQKDRIAMLEAMIEKAKTAGGQG